MRLPYSMSPSLLTSPPQSMTRPLPSRLPRQAWSRRPMPRPSPCGKTACPSPSRSMTMTPTWCRRSSHPRPRRFCPRSIRSRSRHRTRGLGTPTRTPKPQRSIPCETSVRVLSRPQASKRQAPRPHRRASSCPSSMMFLTSAPTSRLCRASNHPRARPRRRHRHRCPLRHRLRASASNRQRREPSTRCHRSRCRRRTSRRTCPHLRRVPRTTLNPTLRPTLKPTPQLTISPCRAARDRQHRSRVGRIATRSSRQQPTRRQPTR